MLTDEIILVLSEACDPAQITAAFDSLGWVGQKIPAANQQADNERVLATWSGSGGKAGDYASLVDDGFIHALYVSSADDAVLCRLRQLPQLDADGIARKLADPDWRSVIQGIRAAALLRNSALFAPLARLRHRPEEAVRIEAITAMQQLLPTMMNEGARLLHEAVQRQGTHPLWNEFSPAWLRRQSLRWMMHDYPVPTAGIEAALRAALQDTDWEVRVGAIIAATRYRLRSLGGLVENCPLPQVSRNGPGSDDRALLRELRRVACALLAGRTPPVLAADAPPRLRVMDRLAHCLTACAPQVDDRISLLVHALTTPVMPSKSGEVDSARIERDAAGWHINGVRLAHVPAIDGFRGDGIDTPVSPYKGQAFFLSVDPLAAASGPRLFDADAAREWQSRSAGQWRLPTVAEWEFAARGNDGRLFPWGNGYQEDCHETPGPWATFGHGAQPEWAIDETGVLWCCGPATSMLGQGEQPACIRPVALE